MEKRSIHKKLFTLAASLLLCCLMLELGVRLTLGDRIVLYPRFHARAEYGPYTIRRLRPNARFRHTSRDGSWNFVINSRGFRATREYPYAKPAGCLRVICVGDSHTQGFECRQDMTYSAVIERYLNRHCGTTEVVNAGVSGFSTAEALVFVENEAFRYHPDVIVLGFFANDLDDNIRADLFRMEGGALVPHRFEYIPAVGILDVLDGCPPLRWLGQHSYLYSHLFNTAWNWKKTRHLKNAEHAMEEEYAVKQEDTNAGIALYKQNLARALVERLYAVCRSNNMALVILDIPQLGDGDHSFQSSIPADLRTSFEMHSDVLIASDAVLRDYDGIADLFVPHGQRHISEITHMLLGVAAAKAIERQIIVSRPNGTATADPTGRIQRTR